MPNGRDGGPPRKSAAPNRRRDKTLWTHGDEGGSPEPGRQGGLNMPRYEYLCEECKRRFELIMTISEREKAKPTCPDCKGTNVSPQFSGFIAQTGKKS
jgi:putative FmdB family regulatory protein